MGRLIFLWSFAAIPSQSDPGTAAVFVNELDAGGLMNGQWQF